MNYLKTFEIFKGYIDKRAMSNKAPKTIGYVKEPVEIRIDIEKVFHAGERQYRHGALKDDVISNDDIIETIELAIEDLTIALMQDKFDIYQKEDDYPTKGIKAGEPNRFVIKNKTNDLNIVCELSPGENEFTLTVITVMKKPDFRTYHGQYVIEVKS